MGADRTRGGSGARYPRRQSRLGGERGVGRRTDPCSASPRRGSRGPRRGAADSSPTGVEEFVEEVEVLASDLLPRVAVAGVEAAGRQPGAAVGAVEDVAELPRPRIDVRF